MPARPKVTKLPESVREALQARLIANGFGDYDALVDWLGDQGYEISRSSLHRWGEKFEERVRALQISTEQVKTLAANVPDDEGAFNEALMRLAQDKLYNVMLDLQIDPDKIDVSKLFRNIAELVKASVTQKKFAVEAAQRVREQQLAEQRERLAVVAKTKGMSADVVDQIRREILGIAS